MAIGSLYETFEPQEARRRARQLETHFTPKHGRWLDTAEIELQPLSKQCLDRRTERRHACIKGIDWQFRTDEVRTKLERLYPEFRS